MRKETEELLGRLAEMGIKNADNDKDAALVGIFVALGAQVLDDLNRVANALESIAYYDALRAKRDGLVQ